MSPLQTPYAHPRAAALTALVFLASGVGGYGCWGPDCPEPGLDGGEQFRITFVSNMRPCPAASSEPPLTDFRPGDSFVLTAGRTPPQPNCPGWGGGDWGPKPIAVPVELSPFLNRCELVGDTGLRCRGSYADGCESAWVGQLLTSTGESFWANRGTTIQGGLAYRVRQSAVGCSGWRVGC